MSGWKTIRKFCKPMTSRKKVRKKIVWTGKFWQKFSRIIKKNGFKKDLPVLPLREILSCLCYEELLNHKVFLVQFGINLHLWVFSKAEFVLAKEACAISASWKTHKCKFISNWTWNCMISNTNALQEPALL